MILQAPPNPRRKGKGPSATQLTTSSRLGTRKDRRSHSRAESQKVATWTPLTNCTCLAWTALSLTARMENVLARNAMANSKLRAMSNPFRPLWWEARRAKDRSGIEQGTSQLLGHPVLAHYCPKQVMQ